MACRTPIDGLSDAEASSESSSDHSSKSEGKPDQDRPLAACFCCGHRLRKRAEVLLLSMVACQFVCMTLPLLFDEGGQFSWAAALGHWIFNSCSETGCVLIHIKHFSYSCGSFLSLLLNMMFQVVMAREEHQQDPGLLSQASQYMILSFFGQQLCLVTPLFLMVRNTLMYHITTELVNVIYTFLPLMSLGMVQRRLELVERGFGQSLGAGMVAKIRLGVLLVLLVDYGTDALMHYSIFSGVALKPLISLFYQLLGFTNLVVAVIVIVGLARVCAAAEPSRLRAGSYAQAEAIWSRALLRQLCVALVLPCFISGALYLAAAFEVSMEGHRLETSILLVSLNTLSPPLESMCLFIVCGFFQPEHPELFLKKQSGMGNRSSLEVEELLEFFCLLGPSWDASGAEAVMPSYDPWLSTTSDVVRGAIIPFSRAGDCGLAYANCLPGATTSTSTTLPDCMVSHTWSALFLDLVAAVVADSLELDEYGKVAQRLAKPRGAQKLLQEVRRKSCQRYWICAFCVNQHAGICNGFGSEPTLGSDQHSKWDAGRRDTVTGQVFGLCSCSEPKYFDGPICEMNKFDDMMGLLQHRQPNLRHLVAVDRRFELFSRAWCVAELVQSYLSNLPQTVLLLSNRALDVQAECLQTYIFLATLTVLECKASREEDRLQILAKIPDVHEFDVQLQAVIFGSRGLLRNALAGFDRVDAAARAARRAASAAAASEGP
ncbi:unnamed protein product [Polarella glacialis]|uniref:Uncharacterized protein n=1 Tax=Polarella glacialis TaxID=89957 RepID=A0A813LGD7_POLGL|nr:unnamed protein product [Polarella glacialis]